MSGATMEIVGVDLSSQPEHTGLARLRADSGELIVEDVIVGAGDGEVGAAITAATRAGVDVPFGWPAPFVEFLHAHRADALDPDLAVDPHWRRPLVWRATDQHVRTRTGMTPLSVATDKIAYPALRWAVLAANLSAAGLDLTRDGTGRACEVYPAAALRIWGLPDRGYKGQKGRGQRERIVAGLTAMAPFLRWNGYRSVCLEHDDGLDAVLSALIAAQVVAGRYEPPPPQARRRVAVEGWICLPVGPPVVPG